MEPKNMTPMEFFKHGLEKPEAPASPRGVAGSDTETTKQRWVIGEVHPVYGECQMMARLSGEQYRWFIKDNCVSMIPLSMC